LHPEGKEKIIKNFGMDFDDLDIKAFEQFCVEQQDVDRDRTSKGMFAPWIIMKEDFLAMGGHDHIFAPFPYEDSDIFERWILSGYKLIQSRDAFVYHLTCRGHRWSEQIGKDDDYYKKVSQRAAREYLRKWGAWIQNDEFQHPIIKPKYDISFVAKNCKLPQLAALEPLCSSIYVDASVIETYEKFEQPNTKFDLSSRVRPIDEEPKGDIVVTFDCNLLSNEDYALIQQFPFIVKESAEVGYMELGQFNFVVNKIEQLQLDMIKPIWKREK
jgi:hypothetical protein